MANTLKKGAANLQKLAGGKEESASVEVQAEGKGHNSDDEAMIGAIFPRVVRRSLAQLQTLPANNKKTIKDLLAEAINDLLAKYNLPQTATIEHKDRRKK